MDQIVTQGTYLIYQFDDPRDETVIYIGLTNDLERRFKQHLHHKKGILYPLAQELDAEGLELSPRILDSTSDLQTARELEKRWIRRKKPLLNTHHNIAVSHEREHEREEEERYLREINEAIQMGLAYKEAVVFVERFFQSEGDYYNYTLIRTTTQLTRKRSGLEPFSESEILAIALQICGTGEVE